MSTPKITKEEKLIMIKNMRMSILLLCCYLFIGCATQDNARMKKESSPELKDVQTISVSPFTCSDPSIARDVQNSLIGVLLDSYSVTLGPEADVVLRGTIILSSDNSVSEIKAHIMKNGKMIDSVIVTPSETDSSSSSSAEMMGRKTGKKVKEILSR
jgi:hypothetical protein